MRSTLLLGLLALPLAACSPSGGGGEDDAADPAERLAALREHVAELQARPEHGADRVRVQHILISFDGAPRMPPSVTRSRQEAEALAARVLAELEDGADFTRLMSEHSDDDKVVGQYLMSGEGVHAPPDVFARELMAPAFGDVGWRLDVGEVGVAPHDEETSPFGWHVIKRLE